MEFENWLTLWFEEYITSRSVIVVNADVLQKMLVNDMKQAGFEVIKR